MEEPDDATPLGSVDAEIKELLGLFEVPAFARRGADLEHSRARLRLRCARTRLDLLDMVHLRLRQWATAATGPADGSRLFARPIDDLWNLSGADGPQWAIRPESPRRLRAIARDLIASVERFNRRWATYLDRIDLEPINRQVEQYNRYYVLEKECVLGSARLASRHFEPAPRLTMSDIRAEFPSLPVPEWRG